MDVVTLGLAKSYTNINSANMQADLDGFELQLAENVQQISDLEANKATKAEVNILQVELDSKNNTTNSRIDNIVATAGDGTIPTELSDVRVDGFGIAHTTSSARLGFIEKLNSKYCTNYFNIGSLTVDKMLNYTDGTLLDNVGWGVTDYIPVKKHDRIYGAWCNGSNLVMCCLYDLNNNFIKAIFGSIAGQPYDFYIEDDNIAYVRYNVAKTTRLAYNKQYLIIDDFGYLRDNPNYINNNVIHRTTKTVGVGGKDYSSLVSAILNIKDANYNNRYTIEVYEGIYDVVTEILPKLNSGEYANITKYGLFVPDYVDIIGVGKKENIIIRGEVANDYADSNVVDKVSVLNIPFNSKLRNITVRAKNLRYAVHADNAPTDNALTNKKLWNTTIDAENCDFIHLGIVAPHTYHAPAAWGAGTWDGSIRKFKNCKFISYNFVPFSTHNRIGLTIPSSQDFENCEFINYISYTASTSDLYSYSSAVFHSYGSKLNEVINMKGCTGTSFIGLNEQNKGAGFDYKFTGHGNNMPIVWKFRDATSRKNYSVNIRDEMIVKYNKTGSLITIGKPVVYGSDLSNIRIMQPTDNIESFIGIAYQDIVSGSVGTIKTKGYTTLSDIGLTANKGDLIGVVDGSLAISTTNVIGIVVADNLLKLK